MIRFITYTLIGWCCLTTWAFGQEVRNVSVEYDDRSGHINIYYDLVSYSGKEEIYRVRAFYSEDDGETFIQIKEGGKEDIGDNVRSGTGKVIRWDYFIEYPEFTGKDIIFKVEAKWDKSYEIRRLQELGGSESALNSALIPGWGHQKVLGKKGRWWTTAVIYGVVGAGVYYAISANNKFNQYQSAQDGTRAASLLDQANTRGSLALAFIGTGATLWASNMVWVAIQGAKNKKRLGELVSARPASPILLGYNTHTQTMGFQLNFKF